MVNYTKLVCLMVFVCGLSEMIHDALVDKGDNLSNKSSEREPYKSNTNREREGQGHSRGGM